MELHVGRLPAPAGEALEVEIVERKGRGHPDTICDALTEELSRALCRAYTERFGTILHYNVDKALLWGGAARPAFGGGEVIAPIELYLAGRATAEFRGVEVPVTQLAVEGRGPGSPGTSACSIRSATSGSIASSGPRRPTW
jgi:S-adenosylmethionine synthetase